MSRFTILVKITHTRTPDIPEGDCKTLLYIYSKLLVSGAEGYKLQWR